MSQMPDLTQLRNAVQPAMDTVSQVATAGQQLVDPLLAPVQQHVLPWGGPVGKALMGGKKMISGGLDLKAAVKKGDGKEKVFSQDETTGEISKVKRGKAGGGKANAFQKKIGAMKTESGVRKLVGGGIKAVSSVPGFGEAGNGGNPLEWSTPMGGAMKVIGGGFNIGTGSADAGRAIFDHQRTRTQEHEALAENDPLAMGLAGAKHHLGNKRNDGVMKATGGVIKATGGAVDLASNADPTQVLGRTGASVLGALTGKGRKMMKGYKMARDQRKDDKILKARDKAEQGDVSAMEYVMTHDPKMITGQMLMHAQDETKSMEDRKASAARVGTSLRLGEDAQEEMLTGRLSEFEAIYKGRTGQAMEVGGTGAQGKAQRGAGRVGKALFNTVQRGRDATIGKVKAKRRKKKRAKYNLDGAAHQDSVRDEFDKVRAFRGEKVLSEVEETLQQKGMKKKFKLQEAAKDPSLSAQEKQDLIDENNQLDVFKYDANLSSQDAIKDGAKQVQKEKRSKNPMAEFEVDGWDLEDAVKALDARRAAPPPVPSIVGRPALSPPPVPSIVGRPALSPPPVPSREGRPVLGGWGGASPSSTDDRPVQGFGSLGGHR